MSMAFANRNVAFFAVYVRLFVHLRRTRGTSLFKNEQAFQAEWLILLVRVQMDLSKNDIHCKGELSWHFWGVMTSLNNGQDQFFSNF